MKKELLTILCMTLVCASVMLGIMSIYKFADAQSRRHQISQESGSETTAFRSEGVKKLF
ncbi:MAG: hypothetical protein IKB51_01150 [Clostridia bacterium]|nr:hypothetical protein [Clostridia bacterium]